VNFSKKYPKETIAQKKQSPKRNNRSKETIAQNVGENSPNLVTLSAANATSKHEFVGIIKNKKMAPCLNAKWQGIRLRNRRSSVQIPPGTDVMIF
jgi:hypothetical protein